MPTYRYRCGACDDVLEVFHSMTEPGPKKCPGCGKMKLGRLIGAGGGVLLRGDGFYTTENRSDSYKKAEKKDRDASSGKSDSGGKSASKTPATPKDSGSGGSSGAKKG